ncbi:hypothetical protein [uncultured Gimesia sp.]|uniref:hypothetical protein n=1 Tax=uncultured Gimesia sp. TaxID=1678688 RepID=UPI00261AA95E|nr:hypothetical protein [uncultured Gimesia sp.]
MKHSRQRQYSFRTKAILFLIGVVLPIILSLFGIDQRILVIPLLFGPLILMYLFNDLGFVLGCFVFWGTLIGIGQAATARGQVDNFIPGLLTVFGWVPYLLFFGPVFLLSKSAERYKAKWAGTHSDDSQDQER